MKVREILEAIQQTTQQNNQPQQQPVTSNPTGTSSSSSEEATLKSILKTDYSTFVKLLGQNIKDAKFLAAIKSLSNKDRVDLKSMTLIAKNLRPTQNEVDLTQSLAFPLKDANSMKTNLAGGPVAIRGNPIVTSGGGKYIIDGHHRWSQVYVCNPNCSMSAVDISDIKGPFSALKAAQLGIAAATGTVPVATVEGQNLFTIDQQTLTSYVINTIVPEVLAVMRQYKLVTATDENQAKRQAAAYLWRNVQFMQKNNTPVQGAPERGIMPQTDTAKDSWHKDAPNPETTVTEQRAIRRSYF